MRLPIRTRLGTARDRNERSRIINRKRLKASGNVRAAGAESRTDVDFPRLWVGGFGVRLHQGPLHTSPGNRFYRDRHDQHRNKIFVVHGMPLNVKSILSESNAMHLRRRKRIYAPEEKEETIEVPPENERRSEMSRRAGQRKRRRIKTSASTIVAILAFIGMFIVPEVRRLFGLEQTTIVRQHDYVPMLEEKPAVPLTDSVTAIVSHPKFVK